MHDSHRYASWAALLTAGVLALMSGPVWAQASSARVELRLFERLEARTDAEGVATFEIPDTPGPLKVRVALDGSEAKVTILAALDGLPRPVYRGTVKQGEWTAFEAPPELSKFLSGYHGTVRLRINGPDNGKQGEK